jgi:hypothetical protein
MKMIRHRGSQKKTRAFCVGYPAALQLVSKSPAGDSPQGSAGLRNTILAPVHPFPTAVCSQNRSDPMLVISLVRDVNWVAKITLPPCVFERISLAFTRTIILGHSPDWGAASLPGLAVLNDTSRVWPLGDSVRQGIERFSI